MDKLYTKSVMELRKFFVGIIISTIGYLLIICLLLAANASVFNIITSNPGRMKEVIAESGAYDRAGPAIIDKVILEQPDTVQALALNNPKVQQIAETSFSSNFIERVSETALDGIYRWLDGDIKYPEFQIDVTDTKQNFITAASQYGANRLEKLPACTLEQISAQTSIFTANCRPPGITKDVIASTLEREMSGLEGFISKKTISAKEIKDEQGRPVFDQLQNAPQAYQSAHLVPWMLGFIALLAAGALVLLSQTREKGFKRLGITLIVASVLLFITPGAIKYIFSQVFTEDNLTDPITRDIVYPIVQQFNQQAASIYITFGVVSLLIGAVILIVRKYKLSKA